ncbi:PREDICTED: uncharacterized protein LOC105561146, partial [Vollenhovia emeryi]|uniref:uncharacterized protein LOC105561146 n=1 Tax=Vollenhovia emeryi TaxID=411798 RepID=UPI0005F448D2
MPDSMIKELIPLVGQRFHFLTNRKILLQSINQTLVVNNSILDITNISESENNLSVVLPHRSDSEDKVSVVLPHRSDSEDKVSVLLSHTSDLDNISRGSGSSMDTCPYRRKNLRELLSESGTGQKLLTHTRLTPSDRNKLCKIIIEKLLSKSM